MSIIPLLLLLGSAIAVEIKPGTKPYDPENKPYYRVDDEEQTLKLFEKFIKDYERVYDSEQEKQKRFEIFKENLHDVNERNIKNPTAVFGITFSMDLTPEEFNQRYCGYIHKEKAPDHEYTEFDFESSEQAPASFDWRDQNALGPIKDQKQCGSCWAFATICGVESQYAIHFKQAVQLSEQQLVDCDTNSNGCNGGDPYLAYQYLQSIGGAESQNDYPYTGSQGTCAFDQSKVKVKLTGVIDYNLQQYSEEQLKDLLVNTGPLTIGLNGDTVQRYTGGLINDCSNHTVNHAVVLIGYGSEQGAPYWIVRNSWGTVFGEQGYFRMPFGTGCLGFMQYDASTAKLT